jgi:transcriptional regulator with XRE-family HTH domain
MQEQTKKIFTPNQLTIGSFVKNLRIECGVTQKLLSELTAIRESVIVYIENDERIPNKSTIYNIMNALGVNNKQNRAIYESLMIKSGYYENTKLKNFKGKNKKGNN